MEDYRNTNCWVLVNFEVFCTISTVVLLNLNNTGLNVEDSAYGGLMIHLDHIPLSMSSFFSKSCKRLS